MQNLTGQWLFKYRVEYLKLLTSFIDNKSRANIDFVWYFFGTSAGIIKCSLVFTSEIHTYRDWSDVKSLAVETAHK